MSLILGIESTCDETAAAVVADGRVVRSSIVATQFDLHRIYRGVVPEIASRAHIENILPVLRESLSADGISLADVDAIAVSQRPGLIGSLLIGVTAAKTLAWATDKPLVGVDHVQAHLYSVMLDSEAAPDLPAVGLVASGGHTALYLIRSWTDITRLGGTIDDAVGEAYDKVAAILGLPYPGGRPIDELAAKGNPKAIKFPRPLLDRDDLDFSFSGLKTSVLYHVRGHKGRERTEPLSDTELRDVCASFQQACIDVLTTKIRRAVRQHNAQSVIVGGGVSANHGLRAALPSLQVPTYLPQLKYCTDNAAMIAGLGQVMLNADITSDLGMDAITFSALVPSPGTPGEG